MKVKTNLKLAVAIISIFIMAGNVRAEHVRHLPGPATQQQIREAQQIAHMKNILVQLQAEQRRLQAAQLQQQAGRGQYVPLASALHASVLGGNSSSGGLGSTYIGGTHGGLGSTYIGGVSAYSERLRQIERMSPQARQLALALEADRTRREDINMKVNVFGTHVYRR
ncbi:MAG TPA: hypothetical protein VNE58_13895 [Casimicrobiaceae bacterium]|nr:hypothetical protein [Casimicrobiaceae bacterium]